MENFKGFFGIVLAFSLLLCSANGYNKTDPTANVNKTPCQRWISTYYCLQNVSTVCSPEYTLKEGGWLNVSASDTEVFCSAGGCADHTRQVLTCLYYVKPDYWFANKATIKNLNDTINIGCDQGFNGTSIYPQGKH